jgi:hypothetical protein
MPDMKTVTIFVNMIEHAYRTGRSRMSRFLRRLFRAPRERITSSSTTRAIPDNLNGTLPPGGKVMAEDGMGFELKALASRNPFIDKLVKQGYQ